MKKTCPSGHTRMTIDLPDDIAAFARQGAASKGIEVSELITMTLALAWGIQVDGERQWGQIANTVNAALAKSLKNLPTHTAASGNMSDHSGR